MGRCVKLFGSADLGDRDAAPRRCARCIFFVLLAIFLLGAQPGLVNPDAEVEFQTARSLFLRGHAGLSDKHADASSAEIGIVRFVPAPGRQGFDCMQGVDGLYYSWFGIGHALLLVPFYAAGRGLAALFPELEAQNVERALADAKALGANEAYTRAFAEDFFAHLLAGFHSSLFAAGIGFLLFLILAHFGLARRIRISATLLACLTTQLWPGAREGMSDISAGFFLLLALERVLAWRLSGARSSVLLLGGAAAGFSVLCRYGQLLPVAAISAYVLHAALRSGSRREGSRREGSRREGWRREGWRCLRPFLLFCLGAAPFAIALLAFNYLRFGDVRTTGYEAGTSQGYWSFPLPLGLLFLLFSPGKGAVIFSPLLVLAPAGLLAMARKWRAEILMIGAIFVLPWMLSAKMTGWHSSQAWASRYMTLGSVLVIALGLAALLAAPLSRFVRIARRGLLVLAVLGLVVNLGGIVAPYRGYYDLGSAAWKERWKDIDPREDLFQRAVLSPRFSPAIGHWLYAYETLRGRLPATNAADLETSWRQIYGVVPRGAESAGSKAQVLPQKLNFVEDRDFRHLCWIGLARRFHSWLPLLPLLLLVALLALCLKSLRKAGKRTLPPANS